jgi:hypothetical protein
MDKVLFGINNNICAIYSMSSDKESILNKYREYKQEKSEDFKFDVVNSGYIFDTITSYLIDEFIPIVKNKYGPLYNYTGSECALDQLRYLKNFIRDISINTDPDYYDPTSPLYNVDIAVDSNNNPIICSYLILPAGSRFYKIAKTLNPKLNEDGTFYLDGEIWLDYSGRPGNGLPSFTKNTFEHYNEAIYDATVQYFGSYLWTVETTKPLIVLYTNYPITSVLESRFRRFCEQNGVIPCLDVDGYILDLMYFNSNDIWLPMNGQQYGVKELKINRSHNLKLLESIPIEGPEPFVSERGGMIKRRNNKYKKTKHKTNKKKTNKKRKHTKKAYR